MKYELISINYSPDTKVYDVVNNEDGSITETLTDKVCCAIYLTLKNESGVIVNKSLIVESHASSDPTVSYNKRIESLNDHVSKLELDPDLGELNYKLEDVQETTPSVVENTTVTNEVSKPSLFTRIINYFKN